MRLIGLIVTALLFGVTSACDDPVILDPEAVAWRALAVGEDHACAVDTRDNVYCWGSNDRQQLSAQTQVPSPAPTLAVIGSDVASIHAGSGYTCTTSSAGAATCWGDGWVGQLGTGVPLQVAIGQRVRGGPWSALSAGAYHACGIASGTTQCWGGDRYGASLGVQLPVQSRCTFPATEEMWWCALDATTVPTPEALTSVSAGLWQSCGVSASGSAYCWGLNNLSQLGLMPDEECRIIDPVHGDSFFPCAFDPQQVPLPGAATQVVSGASHTCAVLSSGDVYCWGAWLAESGQSALYAGQLGTGVADGSPTPARVASDVPLVSVSANRQFIWTTTCGLDAQGRAYCWGANRSGTLGASGTSRCQIAGTIECSLVPVAVGTDARFIQVHVGEEFVCGLTGAGEIYCWGLNDEGQLGDGSFDSRMEPRMVELIR